MIVSSIMRSASTYLPSKSMLRISGRWRNAPAISRSCGAPAQRVSSLSWIRSVPVAPNTMPPRRPLPTGRASTHSAAGLEYHSSGSDDSGSTTRNAKANNLIRDLENTKLERSSEERAEIPVRPCGIVSAQVVRAVALESSRGRPERVLAELAPLAALGCDGAPGSVQS